ncbi:MAG: DUF3574 domain-containing protein [Desulforegulaceae bacterium]|jgi:hypothetical protein|nr:DUF3574 domain-containing protein [Desulforegulaceae bacterium]
MKTRTLAALVMFIAFAGCTTHGTWARYEMCFGLSRDAGQTVLSQEQWQTFVNEEIIRQFPDGFSLLEADGHWLGKTGPLSEPAKILMVVAPDNRDTLLKFQTLAKAYIMKFQQEAVLEIKSQVTVIFHH